MEDDGAASSAREEDGDGADDIAGGAERAALRLRGCGLLGLRVGVAYGDAVEELDPDVTAAGVLGSEAALGMGAGDALVPVRERGRPPALAPAVLVVGVAGEAVAEPPAFPAVPLRIRSLSFVSLHRHHHHHHHRADEGVIVSDASEGVVMNGRAWSGRCRLRRAPA